MESHRFGGAFRLLEHGFDVDGYMRLAALTSMYVSYPHLSSAAY